MCSDFSGYIIVTGDKVEHVTMKYVKYFFITSN